MFAGAHHALIVVVSGCVSAVLRFTLLPSSPRIGGGEMIAIAQSVAATGTFGNPFPGSKPDPRGLSLPYTRPFFLC